MRFSFVVFFSVPPDSAIEAVSSSDVAKVRRTVASLPGLSRVVGNLTAYYEKHGFSARVSERYRSAFQGEITALFASVIALAIYIVRTIVRSFTEPKLPLPKPEDLRHLKRAGQ